VGGAAERSASDRRAEILRLAAGLFAERGFKATTVRDIAEAAGVLSGSLYHHFDSKESIIDELLRQYADDLLADYRRIIAAGGPPRQVLGQLANSVFASFTGHRAAIAVWQNERQNLGHRPGFAYLAEAEGEVERLWTEVIRQGIDAGEFRKDLDPRLAYRFVRDSIWMAVHWYSSDGPLTTQQLADQYLAIMLDGIDSRRPPPALPSQLAPCGHLARRLSRPD
jgi:AcrR family transcriptional regulator